MPCCRTVTARTHAVRRLGVSFTRAKCRVTPTPCQYNVVPTLGLRCVSPKGRTHPTRLLMAKKTGLIDAVKPLLDDMISAGRWYSDAVYQTFLRDIGELS
ncbi:MAG: DUF3368 domain-containing protein [Gammaproteobacteria bacterium]|nr:DUF3368 domain-containing protein [Gammaproteobacteria bacterium]